MKLLLLFALVFGFAFFGLTLAHQCNECADKSEKCSTVKPATCDQSSQSQKYCGTMTIEKQNGKTTVMKSCVPKNEARCKPGIAVTEYHPEIKGLKATLLCCEGNLCNGSKKLYNGNVLFIAIVLGCVYSVVGLLFN